MERRKGTYSPPQKTYPRAVTPQPDALELLAQNVLFSGVDCSELSTLSSQCGWRDLKKRETLFLQESAADCFFIVAKGEIKVYRLDPKGGRQVVIHQGRVGRVVAALAAFFQVPVYPASAEAVSPTRVLVVPFKGFLQLVERNPQVIQNTLTLAAEHSRSLVQKLDQMMFREVESRLADYLLSLSCGGTEGLKLPPNPEIAAVVGTTSEPVSRKLGHFAQQGWVEIRQRSLRIINRAALERLSKGQYG